MTDRNPVADPSRLEAVRTSGLMDSSPEVDFDRLANLAARLLDAPAAFVTVISQDRQYIKSAMAEGARAANAGTSMDINRSFCQHTVAGKEPFLVEDAREHPLVKDNPSVDDGVIAYAGVPLETSGGEAIGALCVVDSKPRHWSTDDVENLRALARSAMKLVSDRSPAGEGDAERKLNPLLSCVAHHFRMASNYDSVIRGPLDLEAEAAARGELVQSMVDLRGALARAEGAGTTKSELFQAVRLYVDSDQRRQQAAKSFSEGSIDLGTLEGAIAAHIDATDALRITAIDHGAELP